MRLPLPAALLLMWPLGCGDSGKRATRDSSHGGEGSVSVCNREKPGPTNTGVPAGAVLTPSGSLKIETDGAVVENLAIDGEIAVLADDVTIRNVRIRSGDYYPIRYFDNDNRGLLIEDSEIEGTSDDVTAALSFANYTARRLNVHGSADGFKADENVLIEDCWIHDLRNAPEQHNDGVQSTGGKGVTLRHNAISGASNACVQTGDENAATEDLTIECNWLSGGGYTLNIRGTGETRPRNTRIVDNVFSRDFEYGPWTLDDPDPEVSGNTYEDGTPVTYP
ncbi:MAG: right-handed parallel beta-helix repeat-containing protein [Polyangiaceae bacterium]